MRPTTDLTVVVTDADGNTKTLSSQEPHPGDRPTGVTFATQAASGFYTAGFSLARPIFQENNDLHLLDDVKFIGANGDVAYEGYITEMPRSMDDTHTLSVSCAGWMAHAADEAFTAIFVDRDLGRWQGPSTARRVALLGAGYGQVADPSGNTDAAGRRVLRTATTGAWGATTRPIAEAWYDAGPSNTLHLITTDWTRGSLAVDHTDANWAWGALLATDDALAAFDYTGSLRAAGPGSGVVSASTTDRRYAVLQSSYQTAAGGTDGTEFGIDWSGTAVYGEGGAVPLLGASAPYGVAASDVIQYLVGRYCPLLNSAGVQQTTYPIAQLAFLEDTTAYDAFLRVNAYHLWGLAVWEGRTLHYAPIDLTDWDWEVRHDEVGNQIGLQGDSIQSLRAGMIVTFQNAATGQVDRLHPDDHPELRASDITNPWVAHGRRGYGEPYAIPFPTMPADALELGRVKLLEDNQITAPGQFTVQSRIRDRAGNWQPAWKPRAGDRIRLTSSAALSDRPRLIGETQYSHDGQTCTITVDGTARYLDAFLDRMGNALGAANLS